MNSQSIHVHERNDQRLIALHAEVVRLLKADPGIKDAALLNVTRWIRSYGDTDTYVPEILKEWQTILSTRTVEEICTIVLLPDEHGNNLRQSSPFAGLIPTKTRNSIIESYSN